MSCGIHLRAVSAQGNILYNEIENHTFICTATSSRANELIIFSTAWFHYNMVHIYRQVSNIRGHLSRQWNSWSLRCSWSIACRRCSNYIFILHWTLGFNILSKDNCKPSRETFKFWDLVRLIFYGTCYRIRLHIEPWKSNSRHVTFCSCGVYCDPVLLTWINFNPSMHK